MSAVPAGALGALPIQPPDWRRALQSLHGAYAAKTLRGYADDVTIFESWCRTAGLDVMPATATTVADFVAGQVTSVAPRTVKRRVAAVSRAHRLLGLDDPCLSDVVTLALRRGVRLYGRPARQALGLSAPLRDRLISACPETLKGLRDRAIIAVGYDTLCRRSELAVLQIQDVEPIRQSGARVVVRKSKNDPNSQGDYAYLSVGGLAHLTRWLAAAPLDEGPMFRATFRSVVGSEAIDPRTINRVLQSAAIAAGCDAETTARLTAHSLRVGPAQDLAVAGRSILQIMRAGRWRHADAVSDYVRRADINVWGAAAP